MQVLETIIEQAWESRDTLSPASDTKIINAVNDTLNAIDQGVLRVAEKVKGSWHVNAWVKKAILLSFRINDMSLMQGGSGDHQYQSFWYDKVPSKFLQWSEAEFKQAGFRAVPGCFVRKGSFVGRNVVLMPSFVNIGAYIDEGTMIDTWATVGSCAQIGKNCHISGGTGIGGVLEPLQANPVIIENNCFIGARSEIAEGVIVREGAVISMGVYIGASTKIIDRSSGEVTYGEVPPYSVVVPGSTPGKTPDSPSLYAAVIVKQVDEKTRSKTSINDLLRSAA